MHNHYRQHNDICQREKHNLTISLSFFCLSGNMRNPLNGIFAEKTIKDFNQALQVISLSVSWSMFGDSERSTPLGVGCIKRATRRFVLFPARRTLNISELSISYYIRMSWTKELRISAITSRFTMIVSLARHCIDSLS